MVSKNKRINVKVQEMVAVEGNEKYIHQLFRDMRDRMQRSLIQIERFLIPADSIR